MQWAIEEKAGKKELRLKFEFSNHEKPLHSKLKTIRPLKHLNIIISSCTSCTTSCMKTAHSRFSSQFFRFRNKTRHERSTERGQNKPISFAEFKLNIRYKVKSIRPTSFQGCAFLVPICHVTHKPTSSSECLSSFTTVALVTAAGYWRVTRIISECGLTHLSHSRLTLLHFRTLPRSKPTGIKCYIFFGRNNNYLRRFSAGAPREWLMQARLARLATVPLERGTALIRRRPRLSLQPMFPCPRYPRVSARR